MFSRFLLFLRRLNKRQPQWLLLVALGVESSIVLFLVSCILFPFRPIIHYSPLVLDSHASPIAAYLSQDDKWRFYSQLHQLNPNLSKALIYKEDKYFYWHCGVNPIAVIRVFIQNLLHRRITAGASTISMQVVRLTQRRKRTYLNKCIEVFQAIRLEMTHSKAEILQYYINLLPFGRNIEGVHAAARLYFNVAPHQLSLTQCVALSLIPNRPNRYLLKQVPCPLQPIVHRWLQLYQRKRIFSAELLADAVKEPLVFRHFRVPLLAPHFTHHLFHQTHGLPSAVIPTHIDANLQQQIQTVVEPTSNRLQQIGIDNIAVIVLRNRDRAVLSYVGSANFNHLPTHGQIDGVRQWRSPGSTLKPLLFAYACDRGELTPELRLADVMQDFNGYTPENYDQQFHGLVSAKYALCQSLNIPAVSLLQQVGLNNFIQIGHSLNLFPVQVKQLRQDSPYGLSLILGGCEVRLLDLANAYATLAAGGNYVPVRLRADERRNYQPPKRIWSPAACFMTLEMLADMQWNALSFYGQSPKHKNNFVWKTGTSYGRRDGWAIGCNTEYTVGVWAGNFHGLGSPALNGADIAAPLLHHIFGLLPYSSRSFGPMGQVAHRKVCVHSGRPLGQYCPREKAIQDWYIPTQTQINPCNFHQQVWISDDKSESFCNRCKPEDGIQPYYYISYPPDVLYHLREKGELVDSPPPHHAHCPTQKIKQEQPLFIVSPTNGAEVIFNHGSLGKLALEARSSVYSSRLYWFVNNEYIGVGLSSKPIFYQPKIGRQEISCMDDLGSSAKVVVDVKQY